MSRSPVVNQRRRADALKREVESGQEIAQIDARRIMKFKSCASFSPRLRLDIPGRIPHGDCAGALANRSEFSEDQEQFRVTVDFVATMAGRREPANVHRNMGPLSHPTARSCICSSSVCTPACSSVRFQSANVLMSAREMRRVPSLAMTSTRIGALTAAILVMAGCGPSAPAQADPVAAAPPAAKLERLTEFFQDEVATGKLHVVIVLIQQHGRPVYLKCFGVRDVTTKRPMTPDTIFALHSMTKPITSLAAMMLIEEGRLALADPVSKYIPAFAKVEVGVESKTENGSEILKLEPTDRPVNIEDLLRHTSGITYEYIGGKLIRKAYSDANIFRGISTTSNLPNALGTCHCPDSPVRFGATAIPPTFSGTSSKSYPGNRCFSFSSSASSSRWDDRRSS